MPTTHPRPIIKRAVMALAGAVLMFFGYATSWAFVYRAGSEGFVPWSTVFMLEKTVYAPLTLCVVNDWPGAGMLRRLHFEVNNVQRLW